MGKHGSDAATNDLHRDIGKGSAEVKLAPEPHHEAHCRVEMRA
jgi:hypothetical protein